MSAYSPQQKKKQQQKVADDKQLRIMFNNTNEHGICMLDRAGNITSWNMSAARLMGYTAGEAIGVNFSQFFSADEVRRRVPQRALAQALKTGSFVAEGIRIRQDGSHFWAQSFITLARDGEKGTVSFVFITQDISKARVLDKKKEQERDEYIGIASHELKNPITALSLYAELLGSRLELDRDKSNLHMLRDMQGQTARLVSLVDDLLLVNKIEAGTLTLHKETFNPDALVKKTVEQFRVAEQSHQILCVGKYGRLVHADSNRITQVLLNLLANAVKYSPRADKVLVQVSYKEGKCIISVQDFGPGIPKKDQKDIFTRFYRADGAVASGIAGSGLGLHISKSIIKKHRERLWVKSAPGLGSTFSFTLSLP